MKRLLAAAVLAAGSYVGLAPAIAHAQVVTECHSVNVTVNGQAIVDQAGCNTLPPSS